MAAGTYDVVCDAGSTLRLRLIYKDNESQPIDLTGYAARLQVRHRPSSEDAILALDTTEGGGITVGGSNGEISIVVPAATTAGLPAGRHVYDLEIELPGGDTTRLIGGYFKVRPEVTR